MTQNFEAILSEANRIGSQVPVYAMLYKQPSVYQPPDFNSVLYFQYYPLLSHSKSFKVSSQPILGGSADLSQNTGGNSQEISFSAEFSSDLDIPGDDMRGIEAAQYSVDVVAARQTLEALTSMRYENGVAVPPAPLILYFPNLYLGRNEDQVRVEVKSLGFEYTAFFPSGRPRIMTASISMVESIQTDTGTGAEIRFPRASDYVKSKEYYFGPSGFIRVR